MVSMMCPGISYSTVHNLIFHTNGSVQDNQLYTEFCNRKQAHFAFSGLDEISVEMIDNVTLNLIDQPGLEKYDYTYSTITLDYEVITTFMKIHNISATWEHVDRYYEWSNASYHLKVGSYWCEGRYPTLECCPPM